MNDSLGRPVQNFSDDFLILTLILMIFYFRARFFNHPQNWPTGYTCTYNVYSLRVGLIRVSLKHACILR